MGFSIRVRSVARNLFRKRQVEGQLDEEVRAYVDLVADERIAAGMPADEARRSALAEFGGVEQVKQAVRESRSGARLELWWQDMSYGLRQLRRNPAFTATALLTLALGIGATTAIFSAVYSLLLKPLPYPDSQRLMWVSNEWPKMHLDRVMSPNFLAARAETKSFEQLAAYTYMDANLTGNGDPARVTHVNVTANFLPILGAEAQLGRTFTAGEGNGGGTNVVVISDRLWRNRFHADPRVVGSAVTLDGVNQTVIGVLPPRFRFPDVQLEPEVYSPLGLSPERMATDRRILLLMVIGRLRGGVSEQQAQAELQAFFEARTKGYPAGFAHMAEGQTAGVAPLQRYIVGDNRKPLFILLASAGFVLLIACANVANLQLARGVARRHETAVRGALGASRLRLIRQFVVENLILSVLSAALGLLIAVVVTSLIRNIPTPDVPRVALYSRVAASLRLPFGKLSNAIAIDGWVLAFAAGVAILTTLLSGLMPAIGATRNDLRNSLQTAALRITSGRDQRLLRHGLLLAEIGLAVVLLACSGLLVRSFVNVLRYDSGFDAHQMLTAVTLLPQSRYSKEGSIQEFADQVVARLTALPGVQAAAVASTLPIQPYDLSTAMTFDGAPAPPMGMRPAVAVVSATPDYFRTVGTPIVQGRAFQASDTAKSPLVTIVNRAFAKRYFNGDALGKRFHSMAWDPSRGAVTVVGVAEDVRHGGLEKEVEPEMMVPMAQLPQMSISIAVRTAGNPDALANALRDVVAEVDPAQPVFDIQTMDQRVAEAVAQRRLIMLLIACFAALAVVLSAVGVYGVFSYSVSQRMHEMGIRLALGASRGGLLRLIVMRAARLIVLGGLLGVGAALGLSRMLASLLSGVTPHDALSFSMAWVLMTLVALAASFIPAANAARTDVVSVLRSE